MKKIILGITILSTLISCKKELPSNIAEAVFNYELNAPQTIEIDSLVASLDEKRINELSKDSLRMLLTSQEFHKSVTEKDKKAIDELLKYNPEYSNYDEIKNLTPIPFLEKSYTNYYLIQYRITGMKHWKELARTK